MQNYQENIQNLQKCTVAIQRSSDGKVLGTGVIVTNDGLILTCYHVVGSIKNKTLDDIVDLRFPSIPEAKGLAQPIKGDPELDIAFLQLQDKLPEQTTVANLGETVYVKEHKFQSLGFRNPLKLEFGGLYANGTIQGKVSIKFTDRDKIYSPVSSSPPPLVQLKSDQIGFGMSGAPILDTEVNKVIGIISDHYRTQDDVFKSLSLGIPVESIVKVYPAIRDKNPGLKKFNKFLQAIGISQGSPLYDRFEDVYVPPIEYNEIEKMLKERRCIFITGTAEYGKTYTAIKLLWEYYKIGHTPKYIEKGSEITTKTIKKLENMDKKSLENNIIYFEDPVGKTKYEPDKEFEESIVSIIAGLAKLDVYLIVTMRDEIYKDFEPIRKKRIDEHVTKLNIERRSYDYEKRKKMLLGWASLMECKWLKKEELKNMILGSIKNESKLPTPLSIKDFASETTDIMTRYILEKRLDEISQVTPERFARDIEEMRERGEIDKILFLCFPFISDLFSLDFVKTEYDRLLKVFKIEDDYAFEKARKEFRGKVEFSNFIRFSHPSYSEALPFLLLEDGIPTEFNTQIFSYVLVNLAYNRNAAKDVAEAVASNFVKLPENARNLLFMFIESNETAPNVAQAVASNFVKLPDNTRNELLLKLADSENAAYYVANTISSNFDKLPDNVKNLLFEISKKDDPNEIRYLALAITSNYDELPDNVRNLLFEFTRNMNVTTAAPTIFAIISYYKKLPNNVKELVFELAKDNQLATAISYSILTNWKQLPNNVKELVFNLADDKATAPDVAVALRETLNSVPLDLENRLGAILRKYNLSYDRWWED